MKICLINNLYAPFSRGGADRVAEVMADGFRSAGHGVFVISTKPIWPKIKNGSDKNISKIYYISSLYGSLKNIPKFLRIAWHIIDMLDIVTYLKVKSIFWREKPDLVVTNNLKGLSYLLPRLARKLNLKHVHILHDIQLLHPSGLVFYGKEKALDTPLARLYQYICRVLFSPVKIVISPSSWLMNEYKTKNFFVNSKKIILENPLEAINLSQTEGEDSDIVKFIYIGEIEKQKGALFLINAFNKLISENNCRIKLTIIGKGSILEEARNAADKSYIEFKGFLPHSEAMDLLNNHDFLFMPSYCYENAPTVIYEAILCGTPVIASDIGGIGEIINNYSGVLFKPNDEEDFMKKTLFAIANRRGLKQELIFRQKKLPFLSAENYIKKLLLEAG